MKSLKKILMLVLVGAFVFVPMVSVNAEESVREVSNKEELTAALNDSTVTTIKLLNDITTTEKVNIMRDVTIDGNGKKITLEGDHSSWDSTYVLQAYTVNVTLKNIALSGANGGLLINGANVTVEGTLDVSGNSFGGIELGMGNNVTDYPVVNFDNATIVNTTESKTVPTIWSDGVDQDKVTVKYNGVEAAAYETVKGQVQLFLNVENTPEGENYTALDANDYKPEPTEEPEEKPTTPPTEQERVEDTTENPETSDGILLFVSLAVIGLAGTTLAYRRLHN